jgi:hypothetical protein
MNSKFTQQEIARLFSILQNQVVLPNGKLNKAFHLMRSDDENNIIHTQTGYCIGYWGYYQTQGIANCERGLNVVHQYSYIKNTTFCNVYMNGKFQWSQGEYTGKPFNAKV